MGQVDQAFRLFLGCLDHLLVLGVRKVLYRLGVLLVRGGRLNLVLLVVLVRFRLYHLDLPFLLDRAYHLYFAHVLQL